MESLRPNILELCTVFARAYIKAAWDLNIQEMLEAAEEEGLAITRVHVQIRALFNKKHSAKPPPRTNIQHAIHEFAEPDRLGGEDDSGGVS